MKLNSLDQEIRSRIDTLLTEISQLVKSSAFDAVLAALGGDVGSAAPAALAPKRGPGRPRKSVTAPKIVAAPAAQNGKRERRSSEDVQATAEAFLAYVKANSGQRLEQIGTGLGVSTKTLKLPVLKLLAGHAIKTTGAKRGTRYFAAGAGSASVSESSTNKPANSRGRAGKGRRRAAKKA